MKKVDIFYVKFTAPVPGITPYGEIKDETAPLANDGSAVLAGMITDLVYCVYQVLNKVGAIPNNVGEDLQTANPPSQQFISSLEKAFLDRSDFLVKGALALGTGVATHGNQVGFLTGGTNGQVIIKDSSEALGFRFGDIFINLDINLVTNQSIPSSWTTLDMSSLVGTRRVWVKCRVYAIGGNHADFAMRTPGETLNIGKSSDSAYGGGLSASTILAGRIGYIECKTSDTGTVELQKNTAGGNYSLDIIGYQLAGT